MGWGCERKEKGREGDKKRSLRLNGWDFKGTKTGPFSWNGLRLALSSSQTLLRQRGPLQKNKIKACFVKVTWGVVRIHETLSWWFLLLLLLPMTFVYSGENCSQELEYITQCVCTYCKSYIVCVRVS
jgi:hypothetical protein